MSIPDNRKSLIDERIEEFLKLQVINNYYLIIGSGKIGIDFLRYLSLESRLLIRIDMLLSELRIKPKIHLLAAQIPVGDYIGCFCGYKRLVL